MQQWRYHKCDWMKFRNSLLYSNSSAINVYTSGFLSFIQLLTSVIGIPIYLYHFGISTQRCRCLPLGRFLLAASRVLNSGELLVPSSWHVWPPPDLVLVCCLLCWLHVYLPSNFFVSDLVHSDLSCSFSQTPHLCCCQHLPFFPCEIPVFTLVKLTPGSSCIWLRIVL